MSLSSKSPCVYMLMYGRHHFACQRQCVPASSSVALVTLPSDPSGCLGTSAIWTSSPVRWRLDVSTARQYQRIVAPAQVRGDDTSTGRYPLRPCRRRRQLHDNRILPPVVVTVCRPWPSVGAVPDTGDGSRGGQAIRSRTHGKMDVAPCAGLRLNRRYNTGNAV